MFRLFIAGLLVAATVGCDDKKAGMGPQSSPIALDQADAKAAKQGNAPAAEAGGAPAVPPTSEVQRKVIQTADLDILVTDFEEARRQFTKLIVDHKGYIAKSDFQGNVGSKRTGTWTVRVPADTFQTFIDAAVAIGQPVRHATRAEDVTEEFVDAEALVKNLKEEEEALNKLLKEKALTLADIATWKEKIALVRREIGRLEARLQTLGRLTSLSTANVTIRDEKEYVPPTAPTYGTTVGGTFDESLVALRQFGKWVLVILVAVTPWLVAVSPLFVVVWIVRRRVRRAQRGGSPG